MIQATVCSNAVWKQWRTLRLLVVVIPFFLVGMAHSSFHHILPVAKRKLTLTTTMRSHHLQGKRRPATIIKLQLQQQHDDNYDVGNENNFQDSSSQHDLDEEAISSQLSSTSTSRRFFLGTATAATATMLLTSSNNAAWAGNAEVDRGSGLLFVPKSQMLGGGGSDATRGVPLRQQQQQQPQQDTSIKPNRRQRLQPTQQLQTVYEPRFIAYLTRFLLNFDPAARGWWVENKLEEYSWEASSSSSSSTSDAAAAAENNLDNLRQFKFAEFCESVEIGLADYFVGPYGSYSSVRAALAGISASDQVKSVQPDKKNNKNNMMMTKWWNNVIHAWNHDNDNKTNSAAAATKYPKKKSSSLDNSELGLARQGVLNLYALLKARYTSISAKRQLAILFSLISSPDLQPVSEIQALLGEADNATITKLDVIRPMLNAQEQQMSRTSSRRGGGYTLDHPPMIDIDPPPALGDSYLPAKATPVLQPTSRILRIKVTDPGEGYLQPPDVQVLGQCKKRCEACAILDRQGHVQEIVVLTPGFGYAKSRILVKIDPPTEPRDKDSADSRKKRNGGKSAFPIVAPKRQVRTARASVVLEYELAGIDLVKGGNGYVATEPPRVRIRPPERDPDWFIAVQEAPELRMRPLVEDPKLKIQAKATEMQSSDGNVVFSSKGSPTPPQVDAALIDLLRRQPLELLPSSLRPQLVPQYSTSGGVASYQYVIPSLPPIPAYTVPPSPRYRAFDPIFGGVGTVPVTKGALSLSASEYARLALSGALCTVIVRTVLNPLELIKTKQQLGNDQELNDFCIQCTMPPSTTMPPPLTTTTTTVQSDPSIETGGEGDVGPSTALTRPLPNAGENIVLDLAPSTTLAATSTAVLNGQDHTLVSEEVGLSSSAAASAPKLGTIDMIFSLVKLRGLGALFQSADITFLASLVFGSFGFGATELFRRSFTMAFFSEEGSGGGDGSAEQEIVLLVAAALATVITSAAATPFEMLRVRSMGLVESQSWTQVLQEFLKEYGVDWEKKANVTEEAESYIAIEDSQPRWTAIQEISSLAPLWGGFAPTLSRELPFAVTKFLCFDILAKAMSTWINLNVVGEGGLPVQVGVGTLGLSISAIAGALAGVAGAVVSHPADLILTYTSVQRRSSTGEAMPALNWKDIVKDLVSRDGGLANLFVGLPVRAIFFFLVIGLQFFLYDYVKNLFQVGADDLSLVLDVFYAVRAGLVDTVVGDGS